MLQADRNRTERTGTRRRAALRQAIAVSTVARIRLRCCVQLSSAVVERAFSQPDVSRFRAEADENSDHPCQHSGNSGERPIVIVVHSLADSSLKRRIIGSQQIAELMGHAGKRRPDARWRQFVQMRRDDAPGSLDANLHQEAGDPESERGAAKCQNGRTGSDSSAAMTLVTRRPMRSESAPKSDAANHGAGIIDQCDGGDGGVVEAVLHAPDALRMKTIAGKVARQGRTSACQKWSEPGQTARQERLDGPGRGQPWISRRESIGVRGDRVW